MRMKLGTFSEAAVSQIPLARMAEFTFSNEKELANNRKYLYSINKHSRAGWKFRTMREGNVLLVWRYK